jgi:hypothetical protein
MTPFSFEWQWNIDYMIFMGFLYLALLVIACGLVYCAVKTWLQLGEEEKGLHQEIIPSRKKYNEY